MSGTQPEPATDSVVQIAGAYFQETGLSEEQDTAMSSSQHATNEQPRVELDASTQVRWLRPLLLLAGIDLWVTGNLGVALLPFAIWAIYFLFIDKESPVCALLRPSPQLKALIERAVWVPRGRFMTVALLFDILEFTLFSLIITGIIGSVSASSLSSVVGVAGFALLAVAADVAMIQVSHRRLSVFERAAKFDTERGVVKVITTTPTDGDEAATTLGRTYDS